MPPTKALKLDDDEKFALMKFRRNVAAIMKPHHDDYYLARWLRAREWNPETAEEMLRESLKWRERWEVDTVLMNTWEPPDVLLKYYPSGSPGQDIDGSPVIIIPFVGLDVYGLLHTVSKSDIIRLTIKRLEEYLALSAKSGDNQVIAIIDMEGFVLRQFAWRPAGELVISLIQMYEQNYPEILKNCYIINAPKVFALAFSIVKKFLNEYTISKIQIFKSDPRKWQPVLLDKIPVDHLPRHYGGTMVDPDGNPRCISKIALGGKVPKSLYTNRDDLLNNNAFITANIKKGEKLKIDFLAVDEGCCLKWEFRSDGHDIKFGVSCRDEEGTETIVVPAQRVAAHQVDEVGVIACSTPATYTVLFDNSYSYLRNKKIHYNIHLTEPIGNLGSMLPEDNTNM